jgi:hypothetical protein
MDNPVKRKDETYSIQRKHMQLYRIQIMKCLAIFTANQDHINMILYSILVAETTLVHSFF